MTITVMVNKISPQQGDMVFLQYDDSGMDTVGEDTFAMFDDIQRHLDEYGAKLFVVPVGTKIEDLDEKQMLEAGWTRHRV